MSTFHASLLTAVVLIAAIPTVHAVPPEPIFPQALGPGDTIMFIAPAGSLDKKRNTLAKERLEKLGYKVRFPRNLFRKHGYLAGTDEQRAAEIMDAFSDPE